MSRSHLKLGRICSVHVCIGIFPHTHTHTVRDLLEPVFAAEIISTQYSPSPPWTACGEWNASVTTERGPSTSSNCEAGVSHCACGRTLSFCEGAVNLLGRDFWFLWVLGNPMSHLHFPFWQVFVLTDRVKRFSTCLAGYAHESGSQTLHWGVSVNTSARWYGPRRIKDGQAALQRQMLGNSWRIHRANGTVWSGRFILANSSCSLIFVCKAQPWSHSH